MFLAVALDPILSKFVLLSLIIIVIGFFLRVLKQPSVVTYILVGVIAGPHALEIVTDEALITNLGSLGLVLLLFFIGMEIHLPDLIANWRISVIGTLLQLLISLLTVWLLSHYFKWEIGQVITLGFVLSLSSTAVIIKLLQERNELQTQAGQIVIGILIAQDVLIVPMIIVMGYLGGQKPDSAELIRQIIGGAFIIGIIIYIIRKKHISLPFAKSLVRDHEMQVFAAFSACFGFSVITALLGLSPALGAFVAGIMISASKATKWVHDSLHAFKIMFVALFFVSVGLLIDLDFLRENFKTVILLVFLVFIINNTINVLAIRMFCKNWQNSVYAGSLLSQVGEFSFILGSTAYSHHIIQDYMYQLIINTISLSLLFSPIWINVIQKILGLPKFRPR